MKQSAEHNPSAEPLTLRHKLIAAGGASCASAVVVNPLDVVKVSFLCTAGMLGLPCRNHASADFAVVAADPHASSSSQQLQKYC